MDWKAAQVARARLAKEYGPGPFRKDWGGRVPVALVYPNSYFVGMSSLGFQTVYRLFNERDGVVCERFFWEGPRGRAGGPAPVSMESQRPFADFSAIAFSVSFELDYYYIVQLLRQAGLAPYAAERDDGAPLLIAGGACCITNPEPIAPFFDALVCSEAEPVFDRLVEAVHVAAHGGRREAVDLLREVPGVYVPAQESGRDAPKPGSVVRQWARELDASVATSAVLTPDTELSDMHLVEVSRGCGRGCRFCLAGYVFRPARTRSLDRLLAQCDAGLRYTRRIGLTSPAVSDLPELEELVVALHARGAEISLSSMRVDNLSDVVLDTIAASGTRNVTIAPEAGSERLRSVVNKGVDEEAILEATAKVARHDVPQLKMYFMVGLPTEKDDDVRALADLLLRCKAIIEDHGAHTRIVAGVSPFVPKPGTPWQWLGMAPVEVVDRRLRGLQQAVRPHGILVRGESARWAELDAGLSRGDRRLAEVLVGMDSLRPQSWHRAMSAAGLDVDRYVHRDWPEGEALPWQVLDWGLSDKFFRLELRRTQSARRTAGCPPTLDNTCRLCGVCTDEVLGPPQRRLQPVALVAP